MKKKGFTLVELLAVIAILAILVIIALPNVMSMFNNARKNSFSTEAARIMQVAQQQSISDSIMSSGLHCYARLDTSAEVGDRKGDGITGTVTCPELDLSGRRELRYAILFDKSGKVTDYVATDGTYYLNYHGSELRIEDIKSSAAGKTPTTTDSETYALTDMGKSAAKIEINYSSGAYTATITAE